MRTVIAGSRSLYLPQHFNWVCTALAHAREWHGITPTVVISGCAPGVDTLGEDWAQKQGLPIERFPDDWQRYGNRAGHLRNATMAHQCEAVVALWDGKSKGTLNMVTLAVGLKRKVFLLQVPQ